MNDNVQHHIRFIGLKNFPDRLLTLNRRHRPRALQALSYVIGVGREGYAWSGVTHIAESESGRIGRRPLQQ
jgi:hypothetical protein